MSKTSQSNSSDNHYPLIFILNNLEIKKFSVDLWDLFGSEDNFLKALVGKWDSNKGNFKSIMWDWSASNIKHIINILYFINIMQKGGSYFQEDFDIFYKSQIKHSGDLIEALSKIGITKPIYALYVLKYRKQFSALLIDLEKIAWEPNRERPLLITFKPTHYFIVDPDTWFKIRNKSKSVKEWINTYNISKDNSVKFSNIFTKYSNMKQCIYGLIPWHIMHEEIPRSKVLFIKPVERSYKTKVVSDNLIFWELFYYLTGTKRTKYDITAEINHSEYIIKDIPIDAFNKESSVYKHEAGVANVISHVLIELFGKKYLNIEFGGKNEIAYKESTIFKREYRVKQIVGEEKNEYSDSDYDYALNLLPLKTNRVILIDLTTALWKKGLLGYEEYMKKWREMCFNIPNRHDSIIFIWYILINETERKFFSGFTSNKMHHNFEEMLKDLSSKIDMRLIKIISSEEDLANYGGERLVVLKIFKKTPIAKNAERELVNLLNNYKTTIFYKTLITVLGSII